MPQRVAPDDLRLRRAEPADHVAVARLMATPQAFAGTLQQPFPSVEQWRERMEKHDAQHFQIVAEVRTKRDDDAGNDGAGNDGAGDDRAVNDRAVDDRTVDAESFEVVGHLGLNTMPQQRRSHVAALGISIHDDWQGRGIGSAMMAAALERADRWMNLLRIELTVFTANEAAIALYRRHGFVVEGTHRAYALRDGVYADALTMARLHPNPPRLPADSAHA